MAGKIISVQSGKGGVGKTTIALNLASSLARDYGKKVLLVDGNISTPHIHIYLKDLDLSKLTLDDIVMHNVDFDPYSLQRIGGMHVLPSRGFRNPDFFNYEDYKSAIYYLKPDYDFIILDSSPGIGAEMLANLSLSDLILFVSGPHVPDVVDVLRIREIADNMGKESQGVVLNKVGRVGNHIKPKDVEAVSGLQVVGKVPYDTAMHKAVALGKPVVHLYPKARASIEIRKLAGIIAGKKPKIGLIDRIRTLI